MNLSQLVKQVLDIVKPMIPTNIEIRQELQEDCEPVKADVTQIHQIVLNLIEPAYSAAAKSGVRVAIAANYQCIRHVLE